MNIQFKITLLLSSVLFISACGSDNKTEAPVDQSDNFPLNEITNPVVFVQDYALDSSVLSPVSSQRKLLLYKMLGVDGEQTVASTLVFVPNIPVTPPSNGYRIVVWAHGTTGVADACAPSAQGLGSYSGVIQALLNSGYIVVAPDYEGLGTGGNHPFLNLKSEAFSITDAVVASRDYLSKQGLNVSRQWMTIGHSQGGHAALGVAQYAARAKLDYKGTIALAPASNLLTILRGGELQASQLPVSQQQPIYASLDAFTSLAVAGMQGHKVSVSYGQAFKSDLAALAPKAETECYNQLVGSLYSAMSQHLTNNSNFTNYGRLQDNFAEDPVIKNFLEKDSQPLLKKVTTPIVIYQGSADTTVPIAATNILVNNATTLGTTIQYKTDTSASITPKWDHSTVVASNMVSVLTDIHTLMPIN